MKLIKGKIIAGENVGNGVIDFTVRTGYKTNIVLCDEVVVASDKEFDIHSLYELVNYLTNKPELISIPEVKMGVFALNKILNIA